MPGIVDDTVALADLDYEQIKAVIYDIRAKEEWGKFMITSSGDGTVDPTLGEECDPANEPPFDVIYDANESTTDFDLAEYPDADDPRSSGDTTAFPTVANHKVSWIAADTVEDLAGNTDRVEYIAEGYYSCTSASFLVAYSGCGDGVPSNGPPEANAFNLSHPKNQRNGVLGFEACDDGGISGDGCADDCSAVTDGYECLKWGDVCTPKCGNGHIEGFLTPTRDSFGNAIYNTILSTDPDTGVITYDTSSGITAWEFEYEKNDAGTENREECDFGAYNSPRTLADTTYEDVY